MNLEYKIIDNKFYNVKDVLKNEFHISDRLITRLKKENRIFLNNENVYVTKLVNINDEIKVNLNFEEESLNIVSTDIPIDILYEDEYLLFINKPPFMSIHPSVSHYTDTLSNGVKNYYDKIGLKTKIRPVNRLDKNTSGIVLFAKNPYIQELLISQMKTKSFTKKYYAVLEGKLEKDSLTVNAPISRKENSIIERKINFKEGFKSITHFTLIKNLNNLSLVECILETGRTHQIRVHSKYIGHPILGDDLYGNKSGLINRQALHCYEMSFIHPIIKKQITITCDLPEDIKNIIN